MRRFAFGCVPALLATACVPAERPVPLSAAVVPPVAWSEQGAALGTISHQWWRGFQDTVLDAHVARALANNTDLLTAMATVEEARGSLLAARAVLRPTLDGDVAAGRSRSLTALGVSTSTSIQPELTASWQLDLFGRLRAQKRAARYQLHASEADRDGVALSVASAVAQAYFTLVALDAQLIVTRETVRTREVSLRLAQDQAQAGYASQFELTQAQSEYESVNGQLPELERAIRNAENALTLLTGDMPAASAAVARGKLQDMKVPEVPATLPSDLLRRRPDLASAEALLAASNASIASSRAAFLPSVALSGSIGQLFVDGLNYDPVTVWSIGSSILAPIFAGGALRAKVDIATAQRDQAAYAYRGAALSAFKDVENGLTDVKRYSEQIAIVLRRREVLQRSLALATDRYRGGYASYIDQLDAQRNLYSTELEAIGIRQSQLQAIVQLDVALGGGWTRNFMDEGRR